MPQCTMCRHFFHPDFTISVDDDVYKCVWCYTGNKEITIKDENTGEEKRVTRDQGTRQYLQYLRWLREQPNVQKIIDGSE